LLVVASTMLVYFVTLPVYSTCFNNACAYYTPYTENYAYKTLEIVPILYSIIA